MDGMDGGHDNGEGVGGFQMMGIMNALKTGDVQTDMFIAMCIPFIIRFLFRLFNNVDPLKIVDMIRNWSVKPDHLHHRYITHKVTRSSWGSVYNMDNDSQNSILLKALRLYIDRVIKLNLDTANLMLTGTEMASSGYYYDYDDDDDNQSSRTMVGMLSRYKVVQSIPDNQWQTLGYMDPDGNFHRRPQEYSASASAAKSLLADIDDASTANSEDPVDNLAPIDLRIETQVESDDDGNGNNRDSSHTSKADIETTTFHLTSPKEGAIDAFIKTVYDWYLGELRSMEDNARYYYDLKVAGPKSSSKDSDYDDSSNGDGAVYKRFRLSDQKSFQSLFFRQKKSLLNLVDHFTKRTGKYAIAGYPHKVGLLLHGPPGTGKTSLIKALAQYTGRSIINVPLSKVTTNAELMSIFFDNKYRVEGSDVAVRLNFKDVIFVMEDVDAASKVVKRRDGKKTADVVQMETIDMPLPKSTWRMLLESTDESCRELVDLLMTKSDRLKKEAQKPEIIRAVAQRVTALPGLGLVGETGDDAALSRIGDEAVENAQTLMNQYSTVEQFVSSHAKVIKTLLDSGTEVDDAFVDELLGLVNDGPISVARSPARSRMSRNVSYTKYDGSEEVRLGQNGKADAAIASILAAEASAQSPAAAEASTDTAGASSMIGPSLGFGLTKSKDALSLAGLLNVLDGVVDTPSRMLIMTTNHPEMLDPALIRPGRIDKKIMLGYMEAEDVVEMLEHYFQTDLTSEQKAGIYDTISSDARQLKLTPAQVEQMTAEHESVDDMIAALGGMAQPTKHPNKFCKTSMSTLTYGI